MERKNIVVIGAGVAGLTTALELARTGAYDVAVVAQHFPGDSSIEYTSPWAGANWMSFEPEWNKLAEYDYVTYGVLKELEANHKEAGIWPKKCISYVRAQDADKQSVMLGALSQEHPWFEGRIDGFRPLTAAELPAGVARGIEWDSFCINVQIYLPWLQSQCIQSGVRFVYRRLEHIAQAPAAHPGGAALVVNCTGVLASRLGGVMDPAVYPGRGQTVLVRNHAPAMVTISGTDDGPDEMTYVMSRPSGGTILGGCYQKGSWDPVVDMELGERIIRRAVELVPELVADGPIDVVRHNVGLRPSRVGGTRVEHEVLPGVGHVVHNYGAGGAGYQSSYGCAREAVRLVAEALA
ncbi:FAD dependent oxidoreductase [Dipodascopsis tothii]|uniref:FAD dependent oxidoreductase n=1 Tax=Dipodascopsis tothii TaxID=44089 RepID=UPI0034CF3ADB